MKKKTFKDYYYIIQDSDQKKYNMFKLTFPSHQWNIKVIDAQKTGRSISSLTVPVEKIDDPKTYLSDKDYLFTEELLVEPAYDNTREYTKQLPDYARNVNLNRILIVNCDCGSKFGELIDKDYPGHSALVDSKYGEYKAKCLKNGHILYDAYNWYRDDKTNDI